MRNIIITMLLAVVVIFSCNTSTTKTVTSALFNTDSLQAGRYTIDINKDTLLQTINGAWLKIAKETFSADSDKVELEIKEAYSISQIIKAGLTTQSNGQLLSSGGMIYINAVAGQRVTIKKPIRIAIPANYLQKDMQLYQGDKKDDGSIDWVKPEPLEKNTQLSNIEKGGTLFQQKCASCHGIGNERETGPNLAHFTKRFPLFMTEGNYVPSHYFKKIYTPYSMEATDTSTVKYLYDHRWSDPYICNLITLFNNKEVDLSDDFNKNLNDWKNIYDYIENESNRQSLPYPRHAYLDDCIDSCNRYKKLKEELDTKKYEQQLKRDGLVKENGPLVDKKADPTWGRSNNPPPDFSDKVQPKEYEAIYYQFTIESFGWFNIDMMLNKVGTEESQLVARVVGTYREKIKIYLIIPTLKVYGEGGPSGKNNDEYMFFKKDGTIPLPQNEKAFILAVTETEASIAYSLTSFTTQKNQQFEVSLKTATREEFAKVIESIGADKLSITVKDSKNASGIRDADKTIKQLEQELKKAENLKPKGCDCNCGKADSPANTVSMDIATPKQIIFKAF